nr:peptidyl-prolyl cis-trans isomerase G-like [Physcomitrium patens]|eukprot:XP_024376650.1 peptidyl-prolyl cis-trans isomerase G-like [Physcomitrella patens]
MASNPITKQTYIKFRGRSDEEDDDYQDVDNFIKEFESISFANKEHAEDDRKRIFSGLLRDHARNWWTHVKRFQVLIDRAGGLRSGTNTGQISEAQATDHFISELEDPIRLFYRERQNTPPTLDNAISSTEIYETAHYKKESRRREKKRSKKKKRRSSSSSSSSASSDSSSSSSSSSEEDTRKASHKRKEKRKKDRKKEKTTPRPSTPKKEDPMDTLRKEMAENQVIQRVNVIPIDLRILYNKWSGSLHEITTKATSKKTRSCPKPRRQLGYVPLCGNCGKSGHTVANCDQRPAQQKPTVRFSTAPPVTIPKVDTPVNLVSWDHTKPSEDLEMEWPEEFRDDLPIEVLKVETRNTKKQKKKGTSSSSSESPPPKKKSERKNIEISTSSKKETPKQAIASPHEDKQPTAFPADIERKSRSSSRRKYKMNWHP